MKSKQLIEYQIKLHQKNIEALREMLVRKQITLTQFEQKSKIQESKIEALEWVLI